MELTILLSKVFGLYMLIAGAGVLWRQRFFMPVLGAFAEDRLVRVVIGALELMAGLFLVNLHTVWGTWPEIIVTLFGWTMFLEGVYYLLASDNSVDKLVRAFNNKTWFRWSALAAIVLGAYLAGYGYGLWP